MTGMNLSYVVPRLLRHFMPPGFTRFLLSRSLIIRPGLETADPAAAVNRYVDVLAGLGRSLAGRRVLVFGYGGRFDIGTRLLEAGAGKVILCDKYAPPDDAYNRSLLSGHEHYFTVHAGHTVPRSDRIEVIQGDLRDLQVSTQIERVDLVVSTSVYEHLDDVEGTTRALASLTQSDGLNIHFVDLRDHFFKYPFEMLHYSETVWRHWLNPTSNHNRYRLWDYRRVFEAYFGRVNINILERDEPAFLRARSRVRPEFSHGNVEEDAVTLIRVVATQPRGPR